MRYGTNSCKITQYEKLISIFMSVFNMLQKVRPKGAKFSNKYRSLKSNGTKSYYNNLKCQDKFKDPRKKCQEN
jgi:hypothetical protein